MSGYNKQTMFQILLGLVKFPFEIYEINYEMCNMLAYNFLISSYGDFFLYRVWLYFILVYPSLHCYGEYVPFNPLCTLTVTLKICAWLVYYKIILNCYRGLVSRTIYLLVKVIP